MKKQKVYEEKLEVVLIKAKQFLTMSHAEKFTHLHKEVESLVSSYTDSHGYELDWLEHRLDVAILDLQLWATF